VESRVVTAPILRVDDVHLQRGERRVLAGVTFEVAQGELVALMGPSGSGKTTILRAIAALEPFDSGSVTIEGVRLEGGAPPAAATLRRLRRTVGLVFQFHHLFEHLPALKNVWLAPVHAHRVPLHEAQQRAQELLRLLEVDHRARAYPRELSGGEAQRVAIARALAVNPRVLMMDEPTASLDPSRRVALAAMLRRLCSENRTIVVSTHDEPFARECATRVLRLENGRISGGG
jgi:ABC-type polar amino acid transport system ATPase subunit